MKKHLKNILKKLTPWSAEDNYLSDIYNGSDNGKFELLFENKLVGTLEYSEGTWVFKYSEELKKEKFVIPLIDFPDVNEVYEFDELVPFFAARIPNLNQPFHEKKIEKLEGDKTSLVSLLKIFGQKSINNPFELKYI